MKNLNITPTQKEALYQYFPEAKQYVDDNDIDSLLEELDAKITEIGFDENYDLNEVGLILQKLYDEIYDQN